jgi:hypothetical protein
MIASSIFRKIFEGMEITYDDYSSDLQTKTEVTKLVQFHFGDNKELARWIQGRNGKQKYPLIWYIIDNMEHSMTETMTGHICFVLFTATKTEYYNDTRSLINYTNILNKLTDQIMQEVENNNVVQLVYSNFEDVYKTFDIPNYGVDLDRFDFTSNLPKQTKAVTVDIVDARRLEFKARINKSNINCLT